MDVKFADSFGDSIKTLIRHQTWWYKTYETIRYKIPVFFKNIYRFRQVLWEHRWWDYRYTITTLRTSLEIMEKGMHNGMEIWESRGKKVAKMQIHDMNVERLCDCGKCRQIHIYRHRDEHCHRG